MKAFALALVVLTAAATPAVAQQQRGFDPRSYQTQHVGQPTRVLVIGTPHLRGTPDSFDPAVLEPLLARLAAFHPDAIAIEALPGRSISQMWQYRTTYPDIAHDYGGRAMLLAAMARQTLSLDMPEAVAEVRRTLQAWSSSPTPTQRRRLAALFAASGDPASAIVQWWRLDAADRIADDNVSATLAAQFATYETAARRNENTLIAARLAVRLGLEQVTPMDDQSDMIESATVNADLEAFMGQAWMARLMADPTFTPLREAGNHLRSTGEALATYRMLNSPAAGRIDADGQWLNMINRGSPHDVGRARVAAWEVRNLRMAANIREMTAQHPGGRFLVIVGSAHKPWLDAYLSMMSDVRVIDAQTVLR